MLNHIRRLHILRVPATARFSTQTPPPTNNDGPGLFSGEKKKGSFQKRQSQKKHFNKRNEDGAAAGQTEARPTKKSNKIVMPPVEQQQKPVSQEAEAVAAEEKDTESGRWEVDQKIESSLFSGEERRGIFKQDEMSRYKSESEDVEESSQERHPTVEFNNRPEEEPISSEEERMLEFGLQE